jgi:hypothetical protein
MVRHLKTKSLPSPRYYTSQTSSHQEGTSLSFYLTTWHFSAGDCALYNIHVPVLKRATLASLVYVPSIMQLAQNSHGLHLE